MHRSVIQGCRALCLLSPHQPSASLIIDLRVSEEQVFLERLYLVIVKLELQLHNENRSYGTPAPVELIVPVMVLARTNVAEVIE